MHEGEYEPLRRPRTLRQRIRDSDYCVRMWGSEKSPPLVLLHGTRDTSVTFQFLVDAFAHEWWVIAPDWRGHGHTGEVGEDAWFHDYLADLDALLDRLLPGATPDLVGHSLGGNVATVYAALRPQRIRCVISLDAFGLVETRQSTYIESLLAWLDRSVGVPVSQPRYAGIEEMARRLHQANARLSWDKALYLASNVSRELPGGGFTWQFDSRRIRCMPTLRRLDEWVDCWRRIDAPRLWVAAADPLPGSAHADADAFGYLLDQIGCEHVVFLPETGHNLQHDAPAPLARVIEQFLHDAVPSSS